MSGVFDERGACVICGATQRSSGKAVVYHHHSYALADWLSVSAVCSRHHTLIHVGEVAEPATSVYRRNSFGLTGPEMDAAMHAAMPTLSRRFRHQWPYTMADRLLAILRKRARKQGVLSGRLAPAPPT